MAQLIYNLHCHTLLSDGVLLPSEIAVRYAAIGYKAIAITDHADYSNIATIVSSVMKFCAKWPKKFPLRVLPGVELTHLPPEQYKPLVAYCRKNGIKVVVGHGETVAEPVIPGTNRACLEAGVDILAHPGHICDADARLAAKRGIRLEITTRSSHGKTNKEVCAQAVRWNAPMVVDHDAHAPIDLLTPEQTEKVALAAGLTPAQITGIARATARFVNAR